MNIHKRCTIIRAMETIIGTVNNTELIAEWRIVAIADGDIRPDTSDEDLEYYIENDAFADILNTFLQVMGDAQQSGGLYVDGIVSKPKH